MISQAVVLTLALAGITTAILLILATPVAYWLARTSSAWKVPIGALIGLPIVLPPTVLGFYLLLLLGPEGWLGRAAGYFFDAGLVFSFWGLVIGSVIYSLPFAVQPIQSAFAAISRESVETARTLGLSPVRIFIKIIMPLARSGFVSAMILVFAHTIGEFGVVLMIGGNIPGRTRVLSIALYDLVENQQYGEAHWVAAGLLVFSFIFLIFFHAVNRWRSRPW